MRKYGQNVGRTDFFLDLFLGAVRPAVPSWPGLADKEAGTKNWLFRGSKYPKLFTVLE
jgi:hypothetical protein